MKIDDIIDYSTMISIIICLIGWIILLGSLLVLIINVELATILFVTGMIIMVVGFLMTMLIEPIFRLVYRYLLSKD